MTTGPETEPPYVERIVRLPVGNVADLNRIAVHRRWKIIGGEAVGHSLGFNFSPDQEIDPQSLAFASHELWNDPTPGKWLKGLSKAKRGVLAAKLGVCLGMEGQLSSLEALKLSL